MECYITGNSSRLSSVAGMDEMRTVKLVEIPDTTRITAMDPDAGDNKRKGYTWFVSDDKEVVLYVKDIILVRMAWKNEESKLHLGSEVRRCRCVVSLIACAEGLLHVICVADSDTPLHHAVLYHRRFLEVLCAMAYVMREVFSSYKDVHGSFTDVLGVSTDGKGSGWRL